MAATLLCAVIIGGCNSTEQALDPSAIDPNTSPPSAATAPGAPAGSTSTPASSSAQAGTASTGTPATATTPARAVPSNIRLQIAPIIGPTVTAAAPLTERLALRARERGIRLAGSTDPGATHVLRGYFSALTEAGETTVIYVWDVLDTAGNRLHRIQGQNKAPAGGAEGWASVTTATMQAVAEETVQKLTEWLSGLG